MKRGIAALFLVIATAALAATVAQPVTSLKWDNPATNTDTTSINITCGTFTYSVTDPAQLQAGQSGTVALSSVITQDGSYTCVAQSVNAAGVSANSNTTEVVTRLNGNFTIQVQVAPDAPANLRFQ